MGELGFVSLRQSVCFQVLFALVSLANMAVVMKSLGSKAITAQLDWQGKGAHALLLEGRFSKSMNS